MPICAGTHSSFKSSLAIVIRWCICCILFSKSGLDDWPEWIDIIDLGLPEKITHLVILLLHIQAMALIIAVISAVYEAYQIVYCLVYVEF